MLELKFVWLKDDVVEKSWKNRLYGEVKMDSGGRASEKEGKVCAEVMRAIEMGWVLSMKKKKVGNIKTKKK